MEQLLGQFYANEAMRESVHDFLLHNLKELAVTKSFKGESTGGIAEAKQAIESSFENLARIYKRKSKKKSSNEAR